MANISAAALGTKPGVLKKENLAGPQPTSVPTTYRELQKTLYYSRSKSASTPGTPAMHWEVARTYTEPKYVDPADTCFFCDGTPHIAYYECKVLHCTLHASILCHRRYMLDCANFGRPTLLLLLWLLLLLLLLMLTRVPVCGSVASGMRCLLNSPKMLMVN